MMYSCIREQHHARPRAGEQRADREVVVIDPDRIEAVDDVMAEVLRRKSGEERLRIAFGLYSSARRMLLCHLRSQHPDWTEEQVGREAARRLSHGAV